MGEEDRNRTYLEDILDVILHGDFHLSVNYNWVWGLGLEGPMLLPEKPRRAHGFNVGLGVYFNFTSGDPNPNFTETTTFQVIWSMTVVQDEFTGDIVGISFGYGVGVPIGFSHSDPQR